MVRVGRPLRETVGDPRTTVESHVRQGVPTVGHQGARAGEPADRQLQGREPSIADEADPEGPLSGR